MKRKPRHGQPQIGYRVGLTSPCYNGYGHATVEVYDLVWIDAMHEVTQWAHNEEYDNWEANATYVSECEGMYAIDASLCHPEDKDEDDCGRYTNPYGGSEQTG